MSADQTLTTSIARLRQLPLPAPVPHASEPDVSVAVIVPTLGDAHYLSDCLESVRRQSFSRWRCYVVDDSSNGNASTLTTSFAALDDRFVRVRHGKKAGLSAARNTGLVLATEPLVQFLDADDMLTPWALERRIDVLRKHWQSPMLAGSYGYVTPCLVETKLSDTRRWKRIPQLGVQDWLNSRGESPFNVHAPLLRTDVVRRAGGFDESLLDGFEDWDLWYRILRHGYVFLPARCVIGAKRQVIREHSGMHLDHADELLRSAQRWAKVDPSFVVANAAMPIDRAEASLFRLVRAARLVGIRGAQLDDPGEAIDADVIGFLDLKAMPETRHHEVARAARSGLVCGLGLSPEVLHKLDSDALARLDHAADKIASGLFLKADLAKSGDLDPVTVIERQSADLALVAESSADVAVLLTASAKDRAAGRRVVAIDIDYAKGDEGASDAWATSDIEAVPYNAFLLETFSPQAVLTRCPRGPVTRELTRIAAARGIDVRSVDEPDRELVVEGSLVEPVRGVAAERSRQATQAGGSIGPLGSLFTKMLPLEEGPLDPKSAARLEELRDSRLGDTAVIIGNGPSLNGTDLELLKGLPTFGVNSIFLARSRLPDPLSYYVVEDRAVFRDNVAEIKAFEAELKLFPTHYRPFFADDEVEDNTLFFRMNTGFYRRDTGTHCHPRFSTDAAARLFCGQSVTTINLQLAYWLGFTKVVLIGMDFTYLIPEGAERSGDVITSRGPDPNHFDPAYFGDGKTWHDPKLDRVLISYRLCREMYDAAGRTIINATVGGRLEAFERQPLDVALGR